MKLKFSATLLLLITLTFGASETTLAQEIGGSLGGSSGVFRPKNPSVKKSEKPVKSKSSVNKEKAIAANRRNAAKAASAKKRDRITDDDRAEIVNNTRKNSSQNASTSGKNNKIVINVVNRDDLFETEIGEGNAARDSRDFNAAEAAYQKAQRLKPNDARAVYGLGNIYTDQQLWDEAEKSYREAVKLDDKNADAQIALSYVLVQPSRGGNIAERLNEALTAARRSISLDSQNPVAYDQYGVALEARGAIDSEAENSYRIATQLDPEYALAYAHLARLLRKNGKLDDAKANYKKAIELATDVPMLILVAEVLQSEQRFDDSETLLRKALTMDANNPTVLYLLGRALSIRNNYEEAEQVFLQSHSVSPRTFAPLASLSSLYIRARRYDEAEKILLRATIIASDSERKSLTGAFGFLGVGDGYLLRGQKADALRMYRKAKEIDPNNAQINSKIAAVKL
ncbi:MAG: tetratricopeptide repeat protein [Pyrinomonadaceae bacterium]|nr:tetratricopeptide repeat protein [Pyrinomonadaceae bacterium]